MTAARKRRVELALLVGILLLAALVRLWALDDVPPGLEHDEVANWLIARDILSGHHAIYFTTAYGHEPLWQYAQAGTVALLGDNWLGIRLVSVLFGLLSIVTAYLLARRFFGLVVALTATAWLSISFWHLFYSRVALRAISLPALSALGAYFLWGSINRESQIPASLNPRASRNPGRLNSILAGFFLGLSAYTYMAARALPFILGGLVLYLALFHRAKLRDGRRNLALALIVAAVVVAPLALWLLTHPGAEFRISEVSQPLDRMLAGDPGPVLDNAVALVKMWSVQGDPWDRQNLPGRPVFVEPLGALLFYAGLLIALWRFRRPAYGMALIWLVGSLIPSLVTSVAPSSIRTINALAVVYIFPGIAVQEIGARRRNTRIKYLALGTLALALAANFCLTTHDYFARWPVDEGVQFVFQTGLTEIARDLDADPDDSPVAIAGLSVDTMDPPTLATALRRRDLAVRWFDAREVLVIPGGGATAEPGESVRLFVPRIVPIAGPLQTRLTAWGATVVASEQYTRYDLTSRERLLAHLSTLAPGTLPGGGAIPPSATFGGQIEFIGHEWLGPGAMPGQRVELLTYWRVAAPPSPPLKSFVHLMASGSDQPMAQNDGLGSPPDTWRPGDLVVRWHAIDLPPDVPAGPSNLYQPQVGWYNPETGQRLRLQSDGVTLADHLWLMPIEVTAP